MKILVTGSAGHLGEALVRSLPDAGHEPVGCDLGASPFTTRVGSIVDRGFVDDCMAGVEAVLHPATLHKPHVATHSRQDFVDTNITGTLNLLESAAAHGVKAFVFTSTTSTFGWSMHPAAGAPAVWVTEDLPCRPRNIYGITKRAAEDLCELVHDRTGMPCLVLRTSRFFPEQDDHAGSRAAFDDDNLKANELLYRRVDIEDAVSAHLTALGRAGEVGFGRFIISATTPFSRDDAAGLNRDAPAVVRRLYPGFEAIYERLGWRMTPAIARVYDNRLAREVLGWRPLHDFGSVLDRLAAGEGPRSALATVVGSKGYHDRLFEDGPYPVE